MLTLLSILALGPAPAQARNLNISCSLTEYRGDSDPTVTGTVSWTPDGFDHNDGVIRLENDGLAAAITVVRDPNHAAGFFYRLHLLDRTTGATTDREFIDSLSLRPRIEGSVSISCSTQI